MAPTSDVTGERRVGTWGSVVVAAVATFGVLVSAAIVAVVVAGGLQWSRSISPAVDNAIPVVVLVLGMLFCGRVAADIAGHRAVTSVVGTALVVAVLGLAVSRSSQAHGDGIEPWQVAIASLAVLVVIGGSAYLIVWRRARR